MSTSITPASSTIVTTLTAPADGDVANAASVNGAFQVLDNSVDAFRKLLYGGGFRVRLSCTSNTVMVIQPLGAVVVTSAAVWTVLSNTSATTVNPTTIAGGSLSASTRYYVYAYNNSGSLGFVANTTAPDVGLMYENANTDKQFVTTFYTDSGSDILTYDQSDNLFEYTALAAANQVLNADNQTSNTALTFGNSLPSQAKFVDLSGYVSSTAVDYILFTQTPGLTTFTTACEANNFTGFAFLAGTGVSMLYRVNTSNAAAYLWVRGFKL